MIIICWSLSSSARLKDQSDKSRYSQCQHVYTSDIEDEPIVTRGEALDKVHQSAHQTDLEISTARPCSPVLTSRTYGVWGVHVDSTAELDKRHPDFAHPCISCIVIVRVPIVGFRFRSLLAVLPWIETAVFLGQSQRSEGVLSVSDLEETRLFDVERVVNVQPFLLAYRRS